MANTIQTNLKEHVNDNLTKYALFLGGTNVVNDVLQNYDPLRTGYGRLFMVRQPTFLVKDAGISKKFKKFKHILEYGNTAIQGIQDITLETNTITGGYSGKGFEVPSYSSDPTNGLEVTVYEFSGSPVREIIHFWINGIADIQTALSHYNGVGNDLAKKASNQTAEFIYVATDITGENAEYVCMFANCFPKDVNTDWANYQSGTHDLVQTTINFAATKYESVNINRVGQALLQKYKVLTNSLNFFSGFDANSPTWDSNKKDLTPSNASNLAASLKMSDNGQITNFGGPNANYDEKTGKIFS